MVSEECGREKNSWQVKEVYGKSRKETEETPWTVFMVLETQEPKAFLK